MRFKVDENLPIEVADLLNAAGHYAATVNDQGIGGAKDPDLAGLVRRESRVLVTLDGVFGEIGHIARTSTRVSWCFGFRGKTSRLSSRSANVSVGQLANEPLAGRLWIVEANRIRVRSDPE